MKRTVRDLIDEAIRKNNEEEPLAKKLLFDQKVKEAEERLKEYAKGEIERIEKKKTLFWKRVGITFFLLNLLLLIASPWEIGIVVAEKVNESVIDPNVRASLDTIVRQNASDYVDKQIGPFKSTVDRLKAQILDLGPTVNEAEALSKQAQSLTGSLQTQSTALNSQIQTINSELSLVGAIVAAQNDNIRAFDQLGAIANQAGNPNANLAVFVRGTIATAPSVSDILSSDPPWDAIGYKAETITITDCKTVCDKYQNVDYKLDIINFVSNCARFSKSDKLGFFAYVISSNASISAVRHACMLMNPDSHLNKNLLAYRDYIDWWNNNKDTYQSKDTSSTNASPH